MPVESRTVGELIDSVSFQISGRYGPKEPLKTEIRKALRHGFYDLFNKMDHPAFRREWVLTTVIDQELYDLPGDFVRMIEPGPHLVSDPTWRLSNVEQQWVDATAITSWIGRRGRPRWYALRGRQGGDGSSYTGDQIIRLIPTPDKVEDFRLPIFSSPEDLMAMADEAEIDARFPRQFVHGIVHAACMEFTQYLDEKQIQMHTAKYREMLEDLARSTKLVVGRTQRKMPFSMGPVRTGYDAWQPSGLHGTDE